MPKLPLPEPMPVSPLIKFGRWSLLITGIVYGMRRRRRLAKREVRIREEERQKKVIRDKMLAEERRIKSDKDIADISKMILGE